MTIKAWCQTHKVSECKLVLQYKKIRHRQRKMSVLTAKPVQPPEPAEKAYSFDTSKWWYELEEIPGPTREVFEEYSKIPSEKVLQHVEELVRAG